MWTHAARSGVRIRQLLPQNLPPSWTQSACPYSALPVPITALFHPLSAPFYTIPPLLASLPPYLQQQTAPDPVFLPASYQHNNQLLPTYLPTYLNNSWKNNAMSINMLNLMVNPQKFCSNRQGLKHLCSCLSSTEFSCHLGFVVCYRKILFRKCQLKCVIHSK